MQNSLETYLDELRLAAKTELDSGHEPFVVKTLPTYLKQRPGDGFAWFLYGDALRILGLQSQSYRALKKAESLALVEQKFFPRTRIAMLMKTAGRRRAAERWFAMACTDREGSQFAWLWVMRGANLSAAANFKRAENCLKKAVRLDGKNSEAYLNLGLLYRAMGRYTEADKVLRESALLDPKDFRASEALESLASIERAEAILSAIASFTDDSGG